MNLLTNKLNEINQYVKEDAGAFINASEENYRRQTKMAAGLVNADKSKKVIMLSGPSASGKTTTAHFLANYLEAMGQRTIIISLDNFYRNKTEAHFFEDGLPDYETVEALDLPHLEACISDLITKREADLPEFDFLTGKRSDISRHVFLNENDVVILEGIHALNPQIISHLPPENLFKLYVSVSSRVVDDRGAAIFSKRDLRFLRRLVRDFKFRASSAENTYMLWKSVLRGEDKYLFPYKDFADLKINSFHSHELCITGAMAEPLLNGIGADSQYYEQSKKLLNKIGKIEQIQTSNIPENSLLKEFIG